jgi:hypothetical protein
LLLIITWLLGPRAEGFSERLESDVLDAVWAEGEPDELPRLPSAKRLGYCSCDSPSARTLAPVIEAIDEWQADVDAAYDHPVDENLAADLKVGPLAALLAGLVDVTGGDFAEVLHWPPKAITSDLSVARSVGGGFVVLSAGAIARPELRRRIATNLGDRDRLIADLHELWRVLTTHPCRRYATYQRVGGHDLLIAFPNPYSEYPHVALAVVRLRAADALRDSDVVWLDLGGDTIMLRDTRPGTIVRSSRLNR